MTRPDGQQRQDEELADVVGRKEKRKQHARAAGDRGITHGLGMFGMVGWSVTVPTLLGLGLGVWIDSRYGGQYSWTLMLMILGLVTGLLTAWYWVQRESQDD